MILYYFIQTVLYDLDDLYIPNLGITQPQRARFNHCETTVFKMYKYERDYEWPGLVGFNHTSHV